MTQTTKRSSRKWWLPKNKTSNSSSLRAWTSRRNWVRHTWSSRKLWIRRKRIRMERIRILTIRRRMISRGNSRRKPKRMRICRSWRTITKTYCSPSAKQQARYRLKWKLILSSSKRLPKMPKHMWEIIQLVHNNNKTTQSKSLMGMQIQIILMKTSISANWVQNQRREFKSWSRNESMSWRGISYLRRIRNRWWDL